MCLLCAGVVGSWFVYYFHCMDIFRHLILLQVILLCTMYGVRITAGYLNGFNS